MHRVMYAWWYGDTDQILDHLCNNPPCVNPMHLRATTQRENVLRSETSITAVNARKTHCDRGHPLSGANLYVRPSGRRRCRSCENANERRRYHERLGGAS